MPTHSTITLENAEGKRTVLAGNATTLRIDSPAPHGVRQGASFSGFAERDPYAREGEVDSAGLVLPSSRVKQLKLLKGEGDEPAADALEVTLAGGKGDGAWTRTVVVPISTVAAPSRPIFYQEPDKPEVLNPPSKLIVGGIPVASNLPGTYALTVSLSGLSSIKVSEVT